MVDSSKANEDDMARTLVLLGGQKGLVAAAKGSSAALLDSSDEDDADEDDADPIVQAAAGQAVARDMMASFQTRVSRNPYDQMLVAITRWVTHVVMPKMDMSSLVRGLQDIGETKTTTGKGRSMGKTKFSAIEKSLGNPKDKCNKTTGKTTFMALANEKAKQDQQFHLIFGDKKLNWSRVKASIANWFVLKRRKVVLQQCGNYEYIRLIMETDPSANLAGDAFIFTSVGPYFGFDGQLVEYCKKEFLGSKQEKATRTSDDGVRVAGTVLLDSNRIGLVEYYKNKRDRAASDVQVNPSIGFFETLALQFNDITVVIDDPPGLEDIVWEIEFCEKPDANNLDRILIPRTWQWVKETLDTYIKLKMKGPVHRWNKQTGGGGGDDSLFIDYIQNVNDKWVAVIWLMDKQKGWPITTNTAGFVPDHMRNEAGVAACGTPRSAKKMDTKDVVLELSRTLNEGRKSSEIMMSKIVEAIVSPPSRAMTSPATPQKTPATKLDQDTPMKRLLKLNSEMDEAEKIIDPDDRRKVVAYLRKKQKLVYDEMEKATNED